jgi:hypothetical protein
MKSNLCSVSCVFCSLLLVAHDAPAAPAQGNPTALPVFKPAVKTLAAFKNGLGFCVETGQMELKDGWAVLDRLPPAALGSLWIGVSGQTGAVTEVIAFKEKISEEAPVFTQAQLLAANVGQKVRLTYSTSPGTPATVLEGTLLEVPEGSKREEKIGELAVNVGWRPPAEGPERREFVLLRTGESDQTKIISLNVGLIQSVELAPGAKLTGRTDKQVNRARIHVEGKAPTAEVNVAYLEKGIVWSPAYRLELENEKTAELRLEAVLANDVEDLDNAEVSFVVGYPNFLYADLLSPLVLQQSVAAFIQSLTSEQQPDRAGRFANGMAQSVVYNRANFDAAVRPEGAYSTAPTLPGETSEDLFFYRKTGVTLKKGERARYLLLAGQVPCEHLYQWDIPDKLNVDERGYRVESGSPKPDEPQVWHVLRLENTTGKPWTTAPAFTLNGALPLAQDVLQYTPPGAKTTLKLTAATELRAEQSQTELGRKALQIEGRSLDEIQVLGKLKVTNWKSKEARVSIKKTLVAEVLSTSADGKVRKAGQKLASLNPMSEIQWEFQLSPGQEKEVQYQCKVLVYR